MEGLLFDGDACDLQGFEHRRRTTKLREAAQFTYCCKAQGFEAAEEEGGGAFMFLLLLFF